MVNMKTKLKLKLVVVLHKTSKKASKDDIRKLLHEYRHEPDRANRLQFLSWFFDCVINNRTFEIHTI